MQNSQALSAEPESALGYRACHHRDNRILDPPRLPFALKTGIVVSNNFKRYLAVHLCEVGRALFQTKARRALGAKHQSSGRGEMICALSFLCGLFSDDPRLRIPHTKRSSGGCAERDSAPRYAHAHAHAHATHNRRFPRLTLAGPSSPIYSAEKGPGVIIDSEN
jgi:hypothetical protein